LIRRILLTLTRLAITLLVLLVTLLLLVTIALGWVLWIGLLSRLLFGIHRSPFRFGKVQLHSTWGAL
jgi:hypothetical protein